ADHRARDPADDHVHPLALADPPRAAAGHVERPHALHDHARRDGARGGDGLRRELHGSRLRHALAGGSVVKKPARSPWPKGARCAVMLTFDFDAETLWLARDRKSADLPGVMSQGRYGANVGVPRLLDLLKREGLRATFYIPGWVVEH